MCYLQQQLTLGQIFGMIAGGRFVHSSVFGNTGVPRVALTLLALRGGEIVSGTRLRFSYATGFKEPRLEETFAGASYSVPNHWPEAGAQPRLRSRRSSRIFWQRLRLQRHVLQQPVSRPDQLRDGQPDNVRR
jgi:hypothetical protein